MFGLLFHCWYNFVLIYFIIFFTQLIVYVFRSQSPEDFMISSEMSPFSSQSWQIVCVLDDQVSVPSLRIFLTTAKKKISYDG